MATYQRGYVVGQLQSGPYQPLSILGSRAVSEGLCLCVLLQLWLSQEPPTQEIYPQLAP